MTKKFSLRRKILLIVLGMVFIPSVLTLLVSYATAVTAIRSHLLDQSRSRLSSYAERLGDRVQSQVLVMRRLADSEDLQQASVAAESETLATDSPHAAALQEVSYYLVRGGDVLGPMKPGLPLRRAADLSPDLKTRLALLPLLAAGESVCGLEVRVGTPPVMQLWIASPVRTSESVKAGDVWIAREVAVADFLRDLRNDQTATQDQILLVSSQSGTINAAADEELTQIFRAEPDLYSQAGGIIDTSDSPRTFYVFVRAGAVSSLTRLSGSESSWLLVQKVHPESAIAALSYGVWTIALYGVIFVALVGVFGIWLSTRMVNPIRRLRVGLRRFEMGELEHRVELRTGDELEELADSANAMAAALQRSYQNLAEKLLQLDDKAQQLEITYEVAKAVNRSLDLNVIFESVVSHIRSLIPSERLHFGLISRDQQFIEMAYVWPEGDETAGLGTRVLLDDTNIMAALYRAEVQVVRLEAHGATPLEQAFRFRDPKMICLVPLIGTSGPLGVLILIDSYEFAFRPQETEILRLISENLSIAVEHSYLYQQVSQFATKMEALVQERTAELEKANQQLIQTEKLAAAGEIAANVAHEINNPLSIIKNYLKLLESQLIRPRHSTEDSEFTRDGVKTISQEIDRIARIVEQLRKVNLPATPEVGPVEVNQEIRQLVELFRHTFQQKQVRLDTQLDEQLGVVMVCGDYLRQILINLMRNANDAVQTGGRISIISAVDSPRVGLFTITVADDGVGIRREHLDKIFDPFFTTKKEGKGTGLGLSVSYGLARNMGGHVEAQSEYGRGTRMSIVLPLSRPMPESGERDVVRRQGKQIIIG